MKAFHEYFPSRMFGISNHIYLEEALCILFVIIISFISWILNSFISFPVPYLFLSLLPAILCLSPRFRKDTEENVVLAQVDGDSLSCSAEICRDELRIDQDSFRDKFDRRVFFRGVNLGGNSKLPAGFTTFDGPAALFPETPQTFVGRPLELDSADYHLKQLRAVGMTFIRLVVTWEAIEPHKRGEYDENFLDYIRELVRRCAHFGLSVVIDAHQDVWSRWTGGDGAPRWTLDAVGFDVSSFAETRAAVVHGEVGTDPHTFPRMAWSCNYLLLAPATMFTLFFGGDVYAPSLRVDGQPVQAWLQGAYTAAFARLAAHLRSEPNVLGFEPMNEPSAGWIGRCGAERPLDRYCSAAPLGWAVSPWDAMRLGAGCPVPVPVFSAPLVYARTELANPAGRRAWLPGRDVWEAEGVWARGPGGPELRRPGHFGCGGGADGFRERHLRPFWDGFARAVRGAGGADLLILTGPPVELDTVAAPPPARDPADRIAGGRQARRPRGHA